MHDFFSNYLNFIMLLALFCVGCSPIKTQLKPIQISNINATIVLDPGHGGMDSGAVGPRNLLEKEITLDIALRMKRLIHQVMPKVKVILTRSRDRYVALEDRVKIANDNQADIFLSLHINSSDNKTAAGFEMYSLDVASNRHAERLAARENKSFSKEKSGVKFILADLRANANREESDKLANLIGKGLISQVQRQVPTSIINDRGLNQALLHVLFVKMPAVLAEIFFISNEQEAKWLSQSSFRERCARGMVLGLKKYLESRSTRSTYATNE